MTVDSGGSAEIARFIVAKVRALTSKPVIAVFKTHIDGDYRLSNAAIRDAFPDTRIYAHKSAIERLHNGEAERWLGIFIKMTEGATKGTRAVRPDHSLSGKETLVFGGLTLKPHHTDHAHTDNDIMIEAPDNRFLFAGDSLSMAASVPPTSRKISAPWVRSGRSSTR